MRIMRLLPLMGLLMLAVPGCQGNAIGGPRSGTVPVPSTLAKLESLAEDAFDKALLNDRSAVRRLAGRLQTDWQSYRPQAIREGAAKTDVRLLDEAISGLSASAGAAVSVAALGRAANAVSAPMPAFYRLYDPIVPADVLALDYLGRELALDGIEGDFTAARSHLGIVEAVWKPLRGRVVDAGGTRAGSEYERILADLDRRIRAHQATGLRRAANRSLDVVDKIEVVFSR